MTTPKSPATPSVPGASIASFPRFRCAQCHQPIPNYGRRKVMVRGVKAYIGQCCQKQAVPA